MSPNQNNKLKEILGKLGTRNLFHLMQNDKHSIFCRSYSFILVKFIRKYDITLVN